VDLWAGFLWLRTRTSDAIFNIVKTDHASHYTENVFTTLSTLISSRTVLGIDMLLYRYKYCITMYTTYSFHKVIVLLCVDHTHYFFEALSFPQLKYFKMHLMHLS
jgi:hypothetical protein